MNHLMETLFSTLDAVPPSKAERRAVEMAEGAIQAAQQKLSYEEFESLWHAISGIYNASELDSFTLGFRLGVQLTLEGLRPVRPNQPT